MPANKKSKRARSVTKYKPNASVKRGAGAARFTRTVLRGVIGRTPIERIDRAKDVAKVIVDATSKKSHTHNKISRSKNKNFESLSHHLHHHRDDQILSYMTPPTKGKPAEEVMRSPEKSPFTTPKKTIATTPSRYNLPKTNRHKSRSTQKPLQYAPGLHNDGETTVKTLSWDTRDTRDTRL